jgi:hypothetical protein
VILRSGLILFVVVTAIAALLVALGISLLEMLMKAGPGGFLDERRWVFAASSALVTGPATIILMLSAWQGMGRPLLIGIVAIVASTAVLALLMYLGSIIGKDLITQGFSILAVPFAAIMAVIVSLAYAISFAVLRTLPVMQPLFGADSAVGTL